MFEQVSYDEQKTSQKEPNFCLVLALFWLLKRAEPSQFKLPSSSEPSQNLIKNFRVRTSRAEFFSEIFELERDERAWLDLARAKFRAEPWLVPPLVQIIKT